MLFNCAANFIHQLFIEWRYYMFFADRTKVYQFNKVWGGRERVLFDGYYYSSFWPYGDLSLQNVKHAILYK